MSAGMVSNLLLIQQSGAGGIIGLFLPMILVFAVFYLLIIRPQQKKQRQMQLERERMLNSLKPGDKVITTGGIHGTIVSVGEDTVQLRIAQSVAIKINRSAVAELQSAEKEAEAVK
jgi:preprotein translocase subunit YajC